MANRGTYIFEKAIEKLEDDSKIKEFSSIHNSSYPDRLKMYLLESRKAFWIGAYDSSMVMAGRATEFLIKDYLDKKGITYNEKDTLARLIEKLKEALGASRKTVEETLLEKISEINKLYRNITAHDNTIIINIDDAKLVWNNLIFVIEKLF